MTSANSMYRDLRSTKTQVTALLPFILIVSKQILSGIAHGQEQPAKDANVDKTGLRRKLDISGNTIGVSTGVNFRHRFVEKSPFSIFMAASYRWLEFTDVDLTPKGGFTVIAGGSLVQPSTLPASLDYGGFTVRGGVDVEF